MILCKVKLTFPDMLYLTSIFFLLEGHLLLHQTTLLQMIEVLYLYFLNQDLFHPKQLLKIRTRTRLHLQNLILNLNLQVAPHNMRMKPNLQKIPLNICLAKNLHNQIYQPKKNVLSLDRKLDILAPRNLMIFIYSMQLNTH